MIDTVGGLHKKPEDMRRTKNARLTREKRSTQFRERSKGETIQSGLTIEETDWD